MGRLTSADFDQELLDIYDEYVHGIIDRRLSSRAGNPRPLLTVRGCPFRHTAERS